MGETTVQRAHTQSVVLTVLLLLVFALTGCASGGQEASAPPLPGPQAAGEYPNGHLLVNTAWLNDNLDHPELRIIDMRSPDAYSTEHIPGAVNVPVGQISSTINDVAMEFDRDEVESTLGEIGLTPVTTVVVYDNLGMMDSARMFWTLEYAGHDDVRILNGGWNAWQGAGLTTDAATPTIEPTDYQLALDDSKLATAEYVVNHLEDPDVILVDARSPQEYTGEVALAERGGHIPGAVNLVWLDALTGGDTVYTIEPDWREQLQDDDVEVLRSSEEIDAMLGDLGITSDREVITYCQTLWRGAHVYFLLRLMGYDDVRGYDGSWAEWGNRADLPVVTGPDPR